MVDAHYRGRLGAGLHLHAESHHEDFQEEQGVMRFKIGIIGNYYVSYHT
jgi:hypothetical protein